MRRLLGLILVLAVFLIFIGLNLDNRCDIRYWFSGEAKLANVPVFLTAFSSFVLGMLFAIPFVISLRLRKPAKAGDDEPPKPKPPKWGKKGKGGPSAFKDDPAPMGGPGGEGGSYGID